MNRLQAPDLLRGLRRHWLAVLLVAALGAAAGTAMSLAVPDRYRAEAQVELLHDTRLDVFQDEPADTYETVDEANRRMESAARAALADDVARRTADQVGISPRAVRQDVEVEPLAGTNVLVFSAEGENPASAARLAQAAAQSFIAVSRETGTEQLLDAALEYDTQANSVLAEAGATAPDEADDVAVQLYSRAYELRMRAAVYEGAGKLIRAADPGGAIAPPGPLRGAGLGLAAGILAGVAVALLLSTRRRPEPAADEPPPARAVPDPA
ncbi:Wzz/FepE/Etk N-terminal domain-containing protein [Modestobacter marinus]|uniref:Wzz/FepE/Etk N-terminal domain-containing protein n=1 Tax=Modestobacter marinus TaxID=477641 RepID=UPI001C956A95|nr:Wzz/FepE/Etk N-terminal domain-containing protein [Modestobacter marinus]